jgi:hypothetical protein
MRGNSPAIRSRTNGFFATFPTIRRLPSPAGSPHFDEARYSPVPTGSRITPTPNGPRRSGRHSTWCSALMWYPPLQAWNRQLTTIPYLPWRFSPCLFLRVRQSSASAVADVSAPINGLPRSVIQTQHCTPFLQKSYLHHIRTQKRHMNVKDATHVKS